MLPDDAFRLKAMTLEAAYLRSDDPIVQSGFSGGRERWVAERTPLVEGINVDGDFLMSAAPTGSSPPTWSLGRRNVESR